MDQINQFHRMDQIGWTDKIYQLDQILLPEITITWLNLIDWTNWRHKIDQVDWIDRTD